MSTSFGFDEKLENRSTRIISGAKLAAARFLALLLDTLLAGFVILSLLLICFLLGAIVCQLKISSAINVATLSQMGASFVLVSVVPCIAFLGLAIMYNPIFESSSLQATPGKALLGLRVATSRNERFSFAAGLWRETVQSVLFAIPGLLYCVATIFTEKHPLVDQIVQFGAICLEFSFIATILFTSRRQTVYDLLSDRVVYFSGHFPGPTDKSTEKTRLGTSSFSKKEMS